MWEGVKDFVTSVYEPQSYKARQPLYCCTKTNPETMLKYFAQQEEVEVLEFDREKLMKTLLLRNSTALEQILMLADFPDVSPRP